MALLQLDNVSVALSGEPVLHGVSLELRAGELLALVGRSGAGKTTLARAALGLLPVDSGWVRLFDVDLASADAHTVRRLRRRAQPVFQSASAALDPRWTVEALLEEPLHVHRLGTAPERRERVLRALDEVGLPRSIRERRPAELSGGQRQRVGLARALVLEPEVLVADEPFSAVDVIGQARLATLLDGLRRGRRLACLLVTHDLRRVAALADRVAVMAKGRVVEVGPAREVLGAPRQIETQALLAATPSLPALSEAPCSG